MAPFRLPGLSFPLPNKKSLSRDQGEVKGASSPDVSKMNSLMVFSLSPAEQSKASDRTGHDRVREGCPEDSSCGKIPRKRTVASSLTLGCFRKFSFLSVYFLNTKDTFT